MDITIRTLAAGSKLNLQAQGAARALGFVKVLLNGLRIYHVIAWTDADGGTERPLGDWKRYQILPQFFGRNWAVVHFLANEDRYKVAILNDEYMRIKA